MPKPPPTGLWRNARCYRQKSLRQRRRLKPPMRVSRLLAAASARSARNWGRKANRCCGLNAALQQMTGRPTALMIAQPGQREDYIHLRAVMATVQPEIVRRTGALRQQIAVQNELRSQELVALKSLGDARTRLQSRRAALARLEGDARGKAGDLSADAAVEFEQAIAQGERARDHRRAHRHAAAEQREGGGAGGARRPMRFGRISNRAT